MRKERVIPTKESWTGGTLPKLKDVITKYEKTKQRWSTIGQHKKELNKGIIRTELKVVWQKTESKYLKDKQHWISYLQLDMIKQRSK